MARDNWERSEAIKQAAAQLIAQADPAIAGMKKASQVRAILEMRHKLAAETGCSFDTTARHITLAGVINKLLGK